MVFVQDELFAVGFLGLRLSLRGAVQTKLQTQGDITCQGSDILQVDSTFMERNPFQTTYLPLSQASASLDRTGGHREHALLHLRIRGLGDVVADVDAACLP